MHFLEKYRGKVIDGGRKNSQDGQSETATKDGESEDAQACEAIYLDHVDIPLHEDLSEFNSSPGKRRTNVDKLDIDLTDLGGESTDFSEPNALSVNPTKPFSHQIRLNLDRLADKGFLTPAQANTLLSNAFRVIKRPILNIARGKSSAKPAHPNLVMITSSLSGEGKTYTAINLALSIAMERDKHVLLVDADVNKPSHDKIFDIDLQYGLIDYLLGRVKSMSEVVSRTNIPSLSVMLAGKQVSQATELLASQAMENFAAEVSGRYPDRIVIFDSPPLLMTTEASVLAPHMGQVILVIEAEKTLRHEVDKSLGLLSNEVVMLLLNKMHAKGDDGGYGYYGYGQPS